MQVASAHSSYAGGFLTYFEFCLVGLWMWEAVTADTETDTETATDTESETESRQRQRQRERAREREPPQSLPSTRFTAACHTVLGFFGAQGGGCGERQRHSYGGACTEIWPECDRSRPRRAGPYASLSPPLSLPLSRCLSKLTTTSRFVSPLSTASFRKPSLYCLLS